MIGYIWIGVAGYFAGLIGTAAGIQYHMDCSDCSDRCSACCESWYECVPRVLAAIFWPLVGPVYVLVMGIIFTAKGIELSVDKVTSLITFIASTAASDYDYDALAREKRKDVKKFNEVKGTIRLPNPTGGAPNLPMGNGSFINHPLKGCQSECPHQEIHHYTIAPKRSKVGFLVKYGWVIGVTVGVVGLLRHDGMLPVITIKFDRSVKWNSTVLTDHFPRLVR